MITLNVKNRRTQIDGTIKMEVSYLGLDGEKDSINKDLLINGSEYYAMDSSNFYMFDEENLEWLRQSQYNPSPVPVPERQADISEEGALLIPDTWQSGDDMLTLIEQHVDVDETTLNLLNIAGSSIITEPITYESNGIYNVPDGKRYSPITVNVPPEEPTLISLVVDSNGTYTPEDTVDGFNKIDVNVEDWRTLDRYFSKDIKVLKAPGFDTTDPFHSWPVILSPSTMLTTVSVPNGTIAIEQAFYGCSYLVFVCIKNSTLISEQFRNCTRLRQLVLTYEGIVSADPEQTSLKNTPLDPDYSFEKGKIYVPDHLLDSYINNSFWNDRADMLHAFSSVDEYDPVNHIYSRNDLFVYDDHLYVCVYEEDTVVPVGELPPTTGYRYNKYFMALAEL